MLGSDLNWPCLTSTTRPGPDASVSWCPSNGSTVEAVTIRGAYAYVVDNDYLRVVEITEPEKPVERATVRLRHGTGAAIALLEQFAIVRTRACSRPGSHTLCSDRLEIYDLVDPAAPTYMATLSMDGASGFPLYDALHVDPADGSLLFGDGQQFVRLDLADPARLRSYAGQRHPAFAIATMGDYAYLFSYFGMFTVVDLHAPDGPSEVFDETHNRTMVTANVLEMRWSPVGTSTMPQPVQTATVAGSTISQCLSSLKKLAFWPLNAGGLCLGKPRLNLAARHRRRSSLRRIFRRRRRRFSWAPMPCRQEWATSP